MEEYLVVRNFEQCRGQLKNRDWSAWPAEAIDEGPVVTLNRIGRIMPQYQGRETFGVTYQPGYDDAPHSQSIKRLHDDMQAPGFEPPSKYPALHALLSSLNQRIYRLDFSPTKTLCR
jgi:hypothetical protein